MVELAQTKGSIYSADKYIVHGEVVYNHLLCYLGMRKRKDPRWSPKYYYHECTGGAGMDDQGNWGSPIRFLNTWYYFLKMGYKHPQLDLSGNLIWNPLMAAGFEMNIFETNLANFDALKERTNGWILDNIHPTLQPLFLTSVNFYNEDTVKGFLRREDKMSSIDDKRKNKMTLLHVDPYGTKSFPYKLLWELRKRHYGTEWLILYPCRVAKRLVGKGYRIYTLDGFIKRMDKEASNLRGRPICLYISEILNPIQDFVYLFVTRDQDYPCTPNMHILRHPTAPEWSMERGREILKKVGKYEPNRVSKDQR